MDVFNRLRTTVSNLSTVLPGNPVTREYEIIKHVGSAGPGLLWKVYQATKRSTKEEAAVFVLEKKQLERYSKRDRELIMDILKQGIAQLTRLRHPSILTVQHPLEESRLGFVHKKEGSAPPSVQAARVQTGSLLGGGTMAERYCSRTSEGVFQVSEGLAFLHNDVKRLHRNLSPESIIVNKKGAWKIAGFDFSVASTNPQDPQALCMKKKSSALPSVQVASPKKKAPEPGLSLVHGGYYGSDQVGSVRTFMCAKKTKSRQAYFCLEWPVTQSEKRFPQHLKHLSASKLNCLPDEAREHVRMLLSITPDIRPDAHQFSKLKFLEDVGVKTLQYLDSLYQWDNLQKSHVYKGLPQVLAQMPKRVALHRVLPCLAKEYASPEMVPFVLPSVLLIAEQATKEEFCATILPDLIRIFRLREPVQILLIFMQKMELLLTKCPPDDIKNHVLPMIYGSLESDAQQIQELCLNIIPDFAHLIDYPSMKNALLPRIKKLCLQTNYLSVRVNCLVCLGKLLEHLDKWLVLDEILPVLPEIRSKEPAVLMGILGIYKLAMTHKKLGLTKDVMACKVIPFLMPLTIENGLTLNQFNAIMSVVKEMIGAVELEHRAKLEQLNSIKKEQRQDVQQRLRRPGHFKLLVGVSDHKCHEVSRPESKGMTTGITYESMPRLNLSFFFFQQSLTLEEKQRLSREQELQQRVQSQPALIPKKPPTAQAPPEAKDLTSTLINSNLASLNIRSPTAPNPFASSPGGDFASM
ncbi:conserved hypothetical protein, partial [Ixodes scapularis]